MLPANLVNIVSMFICLRKYTYTSGTHSSLMNLISMGTYGFSELLLGPMIRGSNHLNQRFLMNLKSLGTYEFSELLLGPMIRGSSHLNKNFLMKII